MVLVHLELKPLKSQHLTQVVELDRLCLGGLWTKEGYQREIESPNSTLLVISLPINNQEETENIIGLGCYWAILEEAHITLLAVHPDYQGNGLGKLLLYALLKDARERRLERATLEVRESNKIALALYEHFGFKIAGKRVKYYQQTGEDALILWRGDLHQPEFANQLKLWQQQIDKLQLKLMQF